MASEILAVPEHQSPLEIADEISWLSKQLVYYLRETDGST